MKLARQETYGIDMEKTGHFFAVHEYKDPSTPAKNYHSGSCVGYQEISEKKSVLNLIRPETFIDHIPKQAYYILFGFLLFLNISMFSMKENLQLKKKFI